MPLQSVESSACGFGNELLLLLLAGKPESHVHSRAAVGLRVAAIESGRINLIIQDPGLVFVAPADLGQPALLDDPAHDQPDYVDRESRWSVVKRIFLRISIVIHHRRQALGTTG